MQNQINLSPIAQFVQIVRSAELSQAKEIKVPIQQARLMSLALTEVLEQLHQDYETMLSALKNTTGSEVVTVSMDGGGFETSK